MKHFIFILMILALAVFGSCASFYSPNNSSWKARDREKAKGTIGVVLVSAEKSGEWGALEREVTELLPLFFSQEAYIVVSPAMDADYAAEVRVREREYPKGWKTGHSLSVEVRLWAGEDQGQPLPLSAGRALSQGKKTFASSKTLSTMLRQAIKSAVKGLPSINRDLFLGPEDE